MDFFKALRLVAMRDVLLDTTEYRLRSIRRWYSKTFFVPLPEVEQMPETDILQVFYEEKYENLKTSAKERPEDAEALETEIDLLLETEEEEAARLMREQELEYENKKFDQMVDTKAEEAQKKEAERRSKEQQKALEGAVPARRAPQANITDGLPAKPPKLLPNIKMRFAADEDFEKLLDEDSTGNLVVNPPTRK